MDQIFEASQLACEIWNARAKPYQVAIGVKGYTMEGNVIIADGTINFHRNGDCLDGQFTIGDHKSAWVQPMEFVYGWLECIEESFHHIYE